MSISETVLERLKACLGPKGYIEDTVAKASFMAEWRGRSVGLSPLVVMPDSTEQVAEVVKICAEHQVGIVPQGGNTGLVEGGIPDDSNSQILLSLGRMDRLVHIDPIDYSMTIEAGMPLYKAQEYAREHNRLFPLSLASEGTCTVGGNIATNAGGIHVMKYGNMRDLVLGLEVVLPNGDIWNGLQSLRKDNAGLDLRNIFVGSEGILGIVTRATVKLFPRPRGMETVFVGFESLDKGIALLSKLREQCGTSLTAFEIIPKTGLELVLKNIPDTRQVLENMYPWHAVIECWTDQPIPDGVEGGVLTQALTEAFEAELIVDAAIAASASQKQDFWKLRENLSEAQREEGTGIKHDISVSCAQLPEFVTRAEERVLAIQPGTRILPYGHAGDGNLHYDVIRPVDMDKESFFTLKQEMNDAIHDLIAEMKGSIAAEHGIGALKADEMARLKPQIDIQMMKTLKNSFDPLNIMNPNRVIRG